MAKRIHEIVTAEAPELMPENLVRDARVCQEEWEAICFFQDAGKFKPAIATSL